MFQRKFVEKIKTHYLFISRRSWHLQDAAEKRGSAGQAADDYNTVHSLCMLDN
jgi:hypothetical protein